MRIAVVTSQYPVPADPMRGRPIFQTVQSLARKADVEVFVPAPQYPHWLRPRSFRHVQVEAGRRILSSIATHDLPYATIPALGRLTNGILAARAIADPIARFRPDLILSYWLYPDAYGASLVAHRLRRPLVSGARGSDLKARDRLSLALANRAMRRSAVVLTVSDDLTQIALRRTGFAEGRVLTVRNGVDARVFHPGDRVVARAHLGVPPDARIVLYVGRLEPAKGLRELLQAVQALDARISLVLIGEGTYRSALERAVAASATERQFLLCGNVAPERVADWMRVADVLVLPSYSEGYPNVLVEALACGCPIVATHVGGIAEIVSFDTGILIPPRDSEALAKAVISALSRAWDRKAFEKWNRSWDTVADETLQACGTALHLAPGGF